jgi:hypothetical protein
MGALLDMGSGPVSFGARYLHGYKGYDGCFGLGMAAWFDYGAEVRAKGASAMITQAVLRAGLAGDTIPAGLELAGGAGTDFTKTVAIGTFAVMLDFLYGGLGVSYEFPIGSSRPSWLGEVEFAVRVHIPVRRYNVHEERRIEARYVPWNQGPEAFHRAMRECVQLLLVERRVHGDFGDGTASEHSDPRFFEDLDESDKQVLWRKCAEIARDAREGTSKRSHGGASR